MAPMVAGRGNQLLNSAVNKHLSEGSSWAFAAVPARRGALMPIAAGQEVVALVERERKVAQGKAAGSVSRIVAPRFHLQVRGNCVGYLFQKLELGRRESTPEWKVQWDCDGLPRSILYVREMAIVAYAEICSPGGCINVHWPRIADAAIAAGVATGIATIIATPTAALPIFQMEFHRQLQGKGSNIMDQRIQVALSVKQKQSGPWCVCKTDLLTSMSGGRRSRGPVGEQ
jgi:hypothetical protein